MWFSQRQGIRPAKKVIQTDSMDADLRNSLWSVVVLHFFSNFRGAEINHYGTTSDEVEGSNMEALTRRLWIQLIKLPVDTVPQDWEDCLKWIRNRFFKAEWHDVYDFLEFLATEGSGEVQDSYRSALNYTLELESSAYRLAVDRIVPVTTEAELDAIERALGDSSPYAGVKVHLQSAMDYLSDRRQPDHRNSIKESISAVEALAKKLTGDDGTTLGAALKVLGRTEEIHPALNKAFSALYGYTNDAHGIRHALLDEPTLTKEDAVFMLVTCSAFVSYAIAKNAREK